MVKELLHYFNGDVMAADVWSSKYAIKDYSGELMENIPTEMHLRLAKEFAKIEVNYQEIEGKCPQIELDQLSLFGKELHKKRTQQTYEDIVNEFFFYFDKFSQIVPQGSIMSNLGNKYIFGSLSNCFGIAPPYDSYSGILRTDEHLVSLMKRRGGVGTHLNNLRPQESIVYNSARTSTGITLFAERYSNTTREVAQNGRRGALMLLLSCNHPDIFKFVTMKDDRTKVTGANVSVVLTDKFMKAVESDNDDFYCTFPINTVFDPIGTNLAYNHLVHIQDGLDVMRIHAKELFDLIVEMAWKNAEPGIAYIDRIQNYSPDGVYEQYRPELCNPCGEQWFHRNETCRLIAENFFFCGC